MLTDPRLCCSDHLVMQEELHQNIPATVYPIEQSNAADQVANVEWALMRIQWPLANAPVAISDRFCQESLNALAMGWPLRELVTLRRAQ